SFLLEGSRNVLGSLQRPDVLRKKRRTVQWGQFRPLCLEEQTWAISTTRWKMRKKVRVFSGARRTDSETLMWMQKARKDVERTERSGYHPVETFGNVLSCPTCPVVDAEKGERFATWCLRFLSYSKTVFRENVTLRT